MKKTLFLVVAACMLLCLTACGNKTETAPVSTEVPAASEPTKAPETAPTAEPTPTPTPEIVYVENGKVVGSTPAPDAEYTFSGVVNTIGSNTVTVTADSITAVFNLVDGTVMPATLNPGDEVSISYVGNASGGNNAKRIDITKEKEVPVISSVIGCVTECDNSHVNLFVDGRLYEFRIDGTTKVNLSYFDVNDYLKITYEGALSNGMTAKQIDPIQGSSSNTKVPAYTAYPVVTSYPVVIYTPKPYDPGYIKPVENPMKNSSAQIVSVGDGVMVVRISGSGNDSWMTVPSSAIPAGTTINPGDRVNIEYNSGTDTITSIKK